tara:strand:+ start:4741 stop:5538 length:798 start_codon:yes stop_codon:yes gene_type:complete
MVDKARVVKLIQKTKKLEAAENKPGSILSENKVSGWSLNFPIKGTCKPSKLCVETCYYAAGMTTWTNSLRKQLWNYEACVEDPIWFAEEVIREYDKKIRGKTDFLRWNGGGDLFPQAVEALNYIGENHPDIVIWVVTRIPEMAVMVEDWPNIYLHFSLDKHSLDRRDKVIDIMTEQRAPMLNRIFFSYQTEKGEFPDIDYLMDNHGVKLFFYDNYKITPLQYPEIAADERKWGAMCPLNVRRSRDESIEGTCNDCRSCFNGHWER